MLKFNYFYNENAKIAKSNWKIEEIKQTLPKANLYYSIKVNSFPVVEAFCLIHRRRHLKTMWQTEEIAPFATMFSTLFNNETVICKDFLYFYQADFKVLCYRKVVRGKALNVTFNIKTTYNILCFILTHPNERNV